MADRLYIQPPEIMELDDNEKVIFLAGPIQGAPDWQSTAIQTIHDIDSSIVVASPRKDYEEGEFVYEAQVDWETQYLGRAAKNGVVLFWLAKQSEPTPGRAYGQTSRFELGEWKANHVHDGVPLVVGVEQEFGNIRYITRRLSQDCPNVPITHSLVETCEVAVKLALVDEQGG